MAFSTTTSAGREIKVEVRHTGHYNAKGHPIKSYTMLKFLRFDEQGNPITQRTAIPHRVFRAFEKKHHAAGNAYLFKLHGYWHFKF